MYDYVLTVFFLMINSGELGSCRRIGYSSNIYWEIEKKVTPPVVSCQFEVLSRNS